MTIPYADYKRIPERDWLGQRVRLVKGITTNGCTEFPAGTEAEIVRKYQGFELRGDADLIGTPSDGLWLVEGSVGDGKAIARRHIAVGVVGEGGVDDTAGNRGHRMREGLAGGGVDIIADIGLRQEVTDGVVGIALGDADADIGRRLVIQVTVAE